MAEIQFYRDFAAPYGVLEAVTPRIRRILARNPSPFTFHGTGTYVIGHGKVAVIDPGPLLAEHVEALLQALTVSPLSACRRASTCSARSGPGAMTATLPCPMT